MSSLSLRISADISRNYLDTLITGDRLPCRALVESLLRVHSARTLLTDLVWPTMEQLQQLFRDDRMNIASLNLATRLNRNVTDQLTMQLERRESNGRKVLIFCGNAEPEELGGQICADLFEAEGYMVRFAGGGVPNDEVLDMVGQERPDLLILFATLPSGLPSARQLIDYLHEVNSCPDMQIMCCGGVYKRAEGLAEEIGADLYAPDAEEAVEIAAVCREHRASLEQQTVGRSRRTKRAAARRAVMAAKTAMRTVRRQAA